MGRAEAEVGSCLALDRAGRLAHEALGQVRFVLHGARDPHKPNPSSFPTFPPSCSLLEAIQIGQVSLRLELGCELGGAAGEQLELLERVREHTRYLRKGRVHCVGVVHRFVDLVVDA